MSTENQLANIAPKLKALPNWIAWKLTDKGKEPFIAGTDRHAKANDSSTWTTFEAASASIAPNGKQGIGFAPGNSGIVGIDIDGCRNPETAEIAPWADEILELIPDANVEVTPSETGIRAWVSGDLPPGERVFKIDPTAGYGDKVQVEFLGEGRYGTVTGNPLFEDAGDVVPVDLAAISKLLKSLTSRYPVISSAKKDKNGTEATRSSAEIQNPNGTVSTNKYTLLMTGEISGNKPSRVEDNYGNFVDYADRSAVDLALCNELALKHGNNPDAIWSEYIVSSIRRAKWLKREKDFRSLTIAKAIAWAEKIKESAPIVSNANVSPDEDTYPAPMDEDAFYGVAGDFVRLVLPQTEADPVALLGNFLVAAGLLFGRNAWVVADGKNHYPVEYLLMAGDSGVGRKGTATNRVVPLMDSAMMFYHNRVLSGLSTGEGLVRALEPKDKEDPNSVRWFLAIIQEFASLLSVMKRDGNTMSAILREAYDGGRLRVLTRKDPLKVDNVNLAVIAHITPEELLNNLTDTDRVNGFANRFLTICVKRWQLLPEGGEEVDFRSVVEKLKEAVEKSNGRGRIQRDDGAKELWAKHYRILTRKRVGLRGALSSRAETHVLRLSLIYALLDGADAIRVEHLRAALAFWEYVEDSVGYIYRAATGDSAADKIMAAMADGPITKKEISRVFGDHKAPDWIEAKLQSLVVQGSIVKTTKQTGNGVRDAWGLKEKN